MGGKCVEQVSSGFGIQIVVFYYLSHCPCSPWLCCLSLVFRLLWYRTTGTGHSALLLRSALW